MQLNDSAIPQLPSRDMVKTIDFYRKLGFEGWIASPAGDYAIFKRGTLEVHFFLHRTLVPAESAFGCYFRVQDVDSLFQQFSKANLPVAGIPRITQLEDKPWGMREFAIIDEDGSLIRIGQEL